MITHSMQVALVNNTVTTSWDDDMAYQYGSGSGFTTPSDTYHMEGMNYYCRGLSSSEFVGRVTMGAWCTPPPPSSPPAPPAAPPCVPCDDVPQEPYMSNNGKTCATWSYAHTDKCALDAAWVANRWCARSCFENGNGYDAGGCCPHPSPPPLPPTPPAPPATPPSPPALPPLGVGYATVLFVDASGGSDSNDGLSLPNAFASISHAVSVATSSTAIFVASGVYRNNNYGLGRLNNGPYVNIKELSDILLTNLPGHSPKIEFDGSGAIRGQDVVGLEISGFEISGPNQEITYDEAMADRLLHSNRFSGRGIAICLMQCMRRCKKTMQRRVTTV